MVRSRAAAGVFLCAIVLGAGCGGSHHAGGRGVPTWLHRLAAREERSLRLPGPVRIRFLVGRARDEIRLTSPGGCPLESIGVDPRTHERTSIGAALCAEKASPPQLRLIGRARAASPDFAIFPLRPRTVRCTIPYGGPHSDLGPLRGVCTTAVEPVRGYSGQTEVVFIEHWRWPPPGKHGRTSTGGWIVTFGPNSRVLDTRNTGAAPPQTWI